jgi:hypothetical protein
MGIYLTILRLRDLSNEIKKSRGFYGHKGRPGKRGGSLHSRFPNNKTIHSKLPVLKSTVQNIVKYALSIQQQSFETIFSIDPNTHTIKFKKDGFERNVPLTDRERYHFTNRISLHNHPSDNTFSIADLYLSFKSKSKSTWVISKSGKLFLLLPKQNELFFSSTEANSIFNYANMVLKELYHSFSKDADFNTFSKEEKEKILFEELMCKLSNEGKFRYYTIDLRDT